MADMFGAPIGIGAAEQDMRQGVLGALQARHMLGQIEMQPAQKSLAEAHARLYGAEAAQKEAQARDLETLQRLEAGMQASEAARAQGRILTGSEAERITAPNASMADPLLKLIRYGEKQGTPARVLTPLMEKAATITQKEAAAANSAMQQRLHKIQGDMAQAERYGELASMGLQGPQQYMQMLMAAASEGLPIDHFPQDWNAAKPLLNGVVMSSMKAKERLELERKKANDLEHEKLWKAQSASAYAAAGAAKARKELTEQTVDLRNKYEGSTSKRAQEDKTSLNARRDALTLKELDVNYPELSLDTSQWKEGRNYRTKDGRLVRLVKDPETGKLLGQPLATPPAIKKLLQRATPVADIPDNEEED